MSQESGQAAGPLRHRGPFPEFCIVASPKGLSLLQRKSLLAWWHGARCSLNVRAKAVLPLWTKDGMGLDAGDKEVVSLLSPHGLICKQAGRGNKGGYHTRPYGRIHDYLAHWSLQILLPGEAMPSRAKDIALTPSSEHCAHQRLTTFELPWRVLWSARRANARGVLQVSTHTKWAVGASRSVVILDDGNVYYEERAPVGCTTPWTLGPHPLLGRKIWHKD